MSGQQSGLVIITNMYAKPINAANAGAGVRNPDGSFNASGTVIGVAQTAQSLLDFATMGSSVGKWLPFAGGLLGAAAALDNGYKALNAYNTNQSIQQSDIAGAIGGVAALVGGAALVLGSSGIIVPIAAVSGLAAGAYQLAASAGGWETDPNGWPVFKVLSAAEREEVQATLEQWQQSDSWDQVMEQYGMGGAVFTPVDSTNLWDYPQAFDAAPQQTFIDQAVTAMLDTLKQAGVNAIDAYDQVTLALKNAYSDLNAATSLTYAKVTTAVASTFTAASAYPQHADPFTLDLDGDGIETVGVNTTNPLLFNIIKGARLNLSASATTTIPGSSPSE